MPLDTAYIKILQDHARTRKLARRADREAQTVPNAQSDNGVHIRMYDAKMDSRFIRPHFIKHLTLINNCFSSSKDRSSSASKLQIVF